MSQQKEQAPKPIVVGSLTQSDARKVMVDSLSESDSALLTLDAIRLLARVVTILHGLVGAVLKASKTPWKAVTVASLRMLAVDAFGIVRKAQPGSFGSVVGSTRKLAVICILARVDLRKVVESTNADADSAIETLKRLNSKSLAFIGNLEAVMVPLYGFATWARRAKVGAELTEDAIAKRVHAALVRLVKDCAKSNRTPSDSDRLRVVTLASDNRKSRYSREDIGAIDDMVSGILASVASGAISVAEVPASFVRQYNAHFKPEKANRLRYVSAKSDADGKVVTPAEYTVEPRAARMVDDTGAAPGAARADAARLSKGKALAAQRPKGTSNSPKVSAAPIPRSEPNPNHVPAPPPAITATNLEASHSLGSPVAAKRTRKRK